MNNRRRKEGKLSILCCVVPISQWFSKCILVSSISITEEIIRNATSDLTELETEGEAGVLPASLSDSDACQNLRILLKFHPTPPATYTKVSKDISFRYYNIHNII